MYKYEECGLPNIWLANGYTLHNTAYGEAVAIDDVEGLHRAIGRSLIEKGGRLTGAEFRFLRTELDMSQKTLGRLLGKTEQAVAKWEKGDSSLPQLADASVRQLYRELLKEKGQFHDLLFQLVDLDNQAAALELCYAETEQGWSSCEALAA